ncbi:hypothetical protein V1264_011018 [Littorina saxatilis]|uniref:Uncharacterized protein n=1 Tax=Littorina saxatilis TaxID=31220 RepID=A0AAN9GK06_9CAEN
MLFTVVKPVLEKSENCLSYKPVTKVTLPLLPDTPRTCIKPSAEPREVTCDSFRGGGSHFYFRIPAYSLSLSSHMSRYNTETAETTKRRDTWPVYDEVLKAHKQQEYPLPEEFKINP